MQRVCWSTRTAEEAESYFKLLLYDFHLLDETFHLCAQSIPLGCCFTKRHSSTFDLTNYLVVSLSSMFVAGYNTDQALLYSLGTGYCQDVVLLGYIAAHLR